MVFQSWNFVFFLILVVLAVRWTTPQWRWLVLLFSSYFFYSLTGWLPLLLLLFSTIWTYQIGKWLGNEKDQKKRYPILLLGISVQVLQLATFKYLGFFESLFSLFAEGLGNAHIDPWVQLILPLGISFYTFQSMGYVFDVYYKIRKPELHFGQYALFVSFFPQIQSGPIGRSKKMLPQFASIPNIGGDQFRYYCLLFVWGLAKKLVIADRLGNYIDPIYQSPQGQGAWIWSWTLVLYTFQLYTDFSAYSDMARSIAGFVGIQIPENFLYPYKANNITDFWRRWHLSLSGWLRDYIYTPVLFAFKKYKEGAIVLAILITFVICGIWHGPKMTFVIFGFLQALLLLFEYFTKDFRLAIQSKISGPLYQSLSVALTFVVISFCFILFRAADMNQVASIGNEFLNWGMALLKNYLMEKNLSRLLGIAMLLLIFIAGEERLENTMKTSESSPKKQMLILTSLIILIGIAGVLGKEEFIYFQF
jgi:D-alanyl-lipoteichoic acid acyltransferase DltB (MBOAT superfamily)